MTTDKLITACETAPQHAALIVYRTDVTVWWPQWALDELPTELPCNASVWLIPGTYSAEYEF